MRVALNIVIISMIFISGMLYYYGMFTSPVISEEEVGPFVLVYEKHIGDYKDSGKKMDNIYYNLINDYKMPASKGFGIYLDNPQKVPADQQRVVLGCIVESLTKTQVKDLSRHYTIREFPPVESVVARFPYKGRLSILAGIIRTYPEIRAYAEKNNLTVGAMMEIYDIDQGVIMYTLPQTKDKNLLPSFFN